MDVLNVKPTQNPAHCEVKRGELLILILLGVSSETDESLEKEKYHENYIKLSQGEKNYKTQN